MIEIQEYAGVSERGEEVRGVRLAAGRLSAALLHTWLATQRRPGRDGGHTGPAQPQLHCSTQPHCRNLQQLQLEFPRLVCCPRPPAARQLSARSPVPHGRGPGCRAALGGGRAEPGTAVLVHFQLFPCCGLVGGLWPNL